LRRHAHPAVVVLVVLVVAAALLRGKGSPVTARILFVNHSPRVSGAEQSMIALATRLDRARYEPAVACPPGELAEAVQNAGLTWLSADIPRFKRSLSPLALWNAAAQRRHAADELLHLARQGGFDLIHANSLSAQLCAPLPKAGLPCVWHLRDLSPLWPLGRALARRATAIICISQAVADRVRRLVRPQALHVVHNGIDAEAFAARAKPLDLRAEAGWPQGCFVAAMIAQLVPWKRHEDFLAALACLNRRSQPARAVIAGADLFGDHPGLEQRLKTMTHSLGLADRVRFLGLRRDIPSVLAACDVLVIPSTAEPFGRVAIEAMSLGKPVVGTRAGGLPEVVADGATGILVPPHAPVALADALARLHGQPELARRMGQRGAQRVRERFDIAAKTAEVQAIYDTLLSRART